MPLGSAKSKKKLHKTPWYIVSWIAVIVTVFSFSTISLAALGQGTSRGYSRDATGILIALNDFRKEVRETGVHVLNIETTIENGGTLNTTPQSQSLQAPQSSSNLPSRLGEVPLPAIKPTELTINTPIEPVSLPTQFIQPPPPAPKPDPLKEKNLEICMQQCDNAFNKCVAATNETPVTTGYAGNDPICISNNNKECKALCTDWYFYPAPTKLPVPPINSGAQTCLLNCRTEMALCFKAAKIKYNVVDPKIPPPQAYFNDLSDCAIKKDDACRAVCPAINPNATAPTQK